MSGYGYAILRLYAEAPCGYAAGVCVVQLR